MNTKTFIEAIKLTNLIIEELYSLSINSQYIASYQKLLDILSGIISGSITDKENKLNGLIKNLSDRILSDCYYKLNHKTISDIQKLNSLFNYYYYDNMIDIFPNDYSEQMEYFNKNLF